MNEEEQEYLDRLARDVDLVITAGEITNHLLEKAKKGDTDSVKLIAELGKASSVAKLRKELFGV